MPPDLISSVWNLPCAKKFLQKAGQDLQKGISLLVIFPGIDHIHGFKQELLRHLQNEIYLSVDVMEICAYHDESPFQSIHKVYEDLDPFNLKKSFDLKQETSLPNVIILDQSESLTVSAYQKWIRAVTLWAEACHSTGAKHSLVLIMTARMAGELELPLNDVRLSYRVWAGIPSVLEVRLLCRMNSLEQNAEAQWREYMLASLAGNDLRLCETLWNYTIEPESAIFNVLKHYAGKRGWDDGGCLRKIKDWRPKPPGDDYLPVPTDTGFELVSCGMTIFTQEYGEEIHSALLAASGREQDIYHRIWRAQAALLLPIIDEVRLRLCDSMQIRYGDGWLVEWRSIRFSG